MGLRGERRWGMFSHPRLPVEGGGDFPPFTSSVVEETSTYPLPNRGIPHEKSGIESPLPSLITIL
jgi:hypothetical protein